MFSIPSVESSVNVDSALVLPTPWDPLADSLKGGAAAGDGVACGVGLSLSHISPLGVEVVGESADIVITPPQVAIAMGASYVKVSRGGSPAVGGGKRGAVSGRSAQSRKRFLDKLHQIRHEAFERSGFLTVTYPDDIEPTPAKVGRDLDCFAERLRRKYPTVGVLWSKEFQYRKSGEHPGKIFPHFHMLILNVPLVEMEWVKRAWFEVVGSTDENHYKAGVRIERVSGSKQAIAYVSKYVSKDELAEVGLTVLSAVAGVFPLAVVSLWWLAYVTAETGRTWGVLGRDEVDKLISISYSLLTDKEFYSARREMKKYVRSQGKKRGRIIKYRSSPTVGVTAYLSSGTAVNLMLNVKGVIG